MLLSWGRLPLCFVSAVGIVVPWRCLIWVLADLCFLVCGRGVVVSFVCWVAIERHLMVPLIRCRVAWMALEFLSRQIDLSRIIVSLIRDIALFGLISMLIVFLWPGIDCHWFGLDRDGSDWSRWSWWSVLLMIWRICPWTELPVREFRCAGIGFGNACVDFGDLGLRLRATLMIPIQVRPHRRNSLWKWLRICKHALEFAAIDMHLRTHTRIDDYRHEPMNTNKRLRIIKTACHLIWNMLCNPTDTSATHMHMCKTTSHPHEGFGKSRIVTTNILPRYDWQSKTNSDTIRESMCICEARESPNHNP